MAAGAETRWDAMVVVGRVARTHGRRGEVIVNLETDFPGTTLSTRWHLST